MTVSIDSLRFAQECIDESDVARIGLFNDREMSDIGEGDSRALGWNHVTNLKVGLLRADFVIINEPVVDRDSNVLDSIELRLREPTVHEEIWVVLRMLLQVSLLRESFFQLDRHFSLAVEVLEIRGCCRFRGLALESQTDVVVLQLLLTESGIVLRPGRRVQAVDFQFRSSFDESLQVFQVVWNAARVLRLDFAESHPYALSPHLVDPPVTAVCLLPLVVRFVESFVLGSGKLITNLIEGGIVSISVKA